MGDGVKEPANVRVQYPVHLRAREPRRERIQCIMRTASGAKPTRAVSWNFRHIGRFDKIRQFNAANLAAGYKVITIHSPREVATDDGQDS